MDKVKLDNLKDGEVLQFPTQTRAFVADEVTISERSDKQPFTLLTFPLTSKQVVTQPYGEESLSHEPGAMRLDRINSGAVPLLFNHNPNDVIGMLTAGRLVGERVWVDAKLFNTPRASEVKDMIAGGLRNVSARYKMHSMRPDVSGRSYTVTDWEVYEGSIVTIPGDATVGIGRNDALVSDVRIDRAPAGSVGTSKPEGASMDETTVTSAGVQTPAGATQQPTQGQRSEAAATQNVQVIDRPTQISGVELEKRRREEITNLCKMNSLPDSYRDHYIGTGWSTFDIGSDILKVMEERGKTNPQPASALGLSKKEVQTFSLRKAILACIDKDWSDAGFELRCSQEVANSLHKPSHPNKFYVPYEVQQRSVNFDLMPPARRMAAMGLGMMGQRDLTVASAGGGGYLVATENQGFIEILRNRAVVFNLGARRMSGLQGNITVPRQSASATGYWLSSESTQITESQQTFVQMAMSPKSVGAYTEISRLLLLQSSPGAEGIVTDDLAAVVALAADLGALNGAGSGGQPAGLIGTSGVGSVASGSLTYALALEYQTDVASSNVVPQAGAYATTPAVAAIAMQKARFANTDTPLWNGNVWGGQMVGFPGFSSNQIPAGYMIFGDWQEMVIGEWGVLEIETNPYANFQAGIIGVRAIYSMDVGIRRPFAWSLASGVTA